jgi:hypothetical protein
MIYLDTKFFEHFVKCLKMQKVIHLQPTKERVDWQHRIDNTVKQCEGILTDAVADEKKAISKKALFIIPDSSLFDELIKSENESV